MNKSCQEIYVDNVSNISVQGPVVTLTFSRIHVSEDDQKKFESEDKMQLTLTGQNFIRMAKTINDTLKKIADRQKSDQKQASENLKETVQGEA